MLRNGSDAGAVQWSTSAGGEMITRGSREVEIDGKVNLTFHFLGWALGDVTERHSIGRLARSASFFKTLVDHEVTVELKNDISIRGTLKSVDQFLNIKLDDIQVVEELKYPHLVSCARSSNRPGLVVGG
ncbi:MAG: hypothetical protein Q9187_008026 [Circinaria calcarea]